VLLVTPGADQVKLDGTGIPIWRIQFRCGDEEQFTGAI
jgi:hypothetical protein